LLGKVVSYLNADGSAKVNADGDLAEGEIVARREHLNRLKKAYQQAWEWRLEFSRKRKDQDEKMALIYEDAVERISMLKRGYFVSPVSKTGFELTLTMRRKRKTFFGTKTVKNKVWYVGLGEYDRRIRTFVDVIYRGYHSHVRYKDQNLRCCPAKDVISGFFFSPMV
jgi:hypothetical protein